MEESDENEVSRDVVLLSVDGIEHLLQGDGNEFE